MTWKLKLSKIKNKVLVKKLQSRKMGTLSFKNDSKLEKPSMA